MTPEQNRSHRQHADSMLKAHKSQATAKRLLDALDALDAAEKREKEMRGMLAACAAILPGIRLHSDVVDLLARHDREKAAK